MLGVPYFFYSGAPTSVACTTGLRLSTQPNGRIFTSCDELTQSSPIRHALPVRPVVAALDERLPHQSMRRGASRNGQTERNRPSPCIALGWSCEAQQCPRKPKRACPNNPCDPLCCCNSCKHHTSTPDLSQNEQAFGLRPGAPVWRDFAAKLTGLMANGLTGD